MELLRSIPQLESLRHEWNALADGQGHALLRHEWFLSAATTLHEAGDLAVAATTSGGRLDAVAPLVRTVVGGVERLELIGAEALHEPTGFLARDASAHERLLDEVLRLRRPLVLQRVTTMHEAMDLDTAARGRGVLIVRRTDSSLAVPLVRGSDEVAGLPAKLRYDLKRARTRAEARGTVTLDVVSPRPGESDAALDAFIQVEASGWKGRHGTALALNRRTGAFFRAYSRLAAEAGTLRLFFLRIGGAIAAAQIAVDVYGRLWVLKIGYDEALARCSPGFLLTAEAIAYASRQGLQSYEFLGCAEQWEERWRPVKRPCLLAVFYPWTVRGGVSASLDMAGAAWRRLRPRRNGRSEAARA
ncbi:MAG: GNAT family N-acetyltransferase [Vicinamibacterales bacterium]